jgi:hypothetical protein
MASLFAARFRVCEQHSVLRGERNPSGRWFPAVSAIYEDDDAEFERTRAILMAVAPAEELLAELPHTTFVPPSAPASSGMPAGVCWSWSDPCRPE